VFRATREVQQYLQPVFDAAPKDLHSQPQPQKTGRKTVRRILELGSRGISIREIADQVGMSKSAVARHLANSSPD
jgi:DNA-binding NarL/FixJ family response regulator